MHLEIFSFHLSQSLTKIWQGHLFSQNGALIYILNIHGTLFSTVNMQIHVQHIFTFLMLTITKNHQGTRDPCQGLDYYDRDLYPRLMDHVRTFHVPETLVLTTEPSVTSPCCDTICMQNMPVYSLLFGCYTQLRGGSQLSYSI